ncbi:arsenic resistance protein [Blastococcus sp. Marseille-P5729]|uniref:arsenic resistance protein n=1 Tax=Blastococcus sp. Marseille-P5729 TaxID=2086582 RepID=UPI000D0F999F|nr:bile acid:sodium symporter [Blastococcus sp. Marseille-P5729]
MSKQGLERNQFWCYLAGLAAGLLVGLTTPGAANVLELAVWPLLAALLYATFLQISLRSIPAAFRDRRFIRTALIGNFGIMPLIVWLITRVVPDDDALRLGLLLVLLVPCTDWFITFTHLAGGDAARATALTPVSLVVQLALLPIYLWLMADAELSGVLSAAQIWPAVLVVLCPLALAALTEVWTARAARRARLARAAAWWPVPLLALVIFAVAAGHADEVVAAAAVLPVVVAAAGGYLVMSLIVSCLLSRAVRLPSPQARTLAFALGTRNSFVVLPVALSLPAGWELTAVVIVMQSLVELLGMIGWLRLVPRVLRPR